MVVLLQTDHSRPCCECAAKQPLVKGKAGEDTDKLASRKCCQEFLNRHIFLVLLRLFLQNLKVV